MDSAEEVARASDEAVMMLDWDRHGWFLERRVSEVLERLDVDVDRETRIRMGPLVRKDVTDVESLPSLLERLRAETRGGRWEGGGQNVYGF